MSEPVDRERLLAVLHAQHQAIDLLMARLATVDHMFLPSKSGPIWDAIEEGHALIQALERGGLPS